MKETLAKELKDYTQSYFANGYQIDKDIAETMAEKKLHFFPIRWIGCFIINVKNVVVCHYLGHAWRDDSYGNPEHGYMGMTCKRCGYSVGDYLY